MMRTSLTGFACTLMAIPLGCSDAEVVARRPTTGGVAVIDLDRIAAALGQDKAMTESINDRHHALQTQLLAWNRARQSDATHSEGVQQANWQEDFPTTVETAKRAAASDLVQHRAHLIEEFRESIRPAVRQEAAARGLSLIVTKNDAVVFDFAPLADITEAVLVRLQPNRPARN